MLASCHKKGQCLSAPPLKRTTLQDTAIHLSNELKKIHDLIICACSWIKVIDIAVDGLGGFGGVKNNDCDS